MKSQPQPDRAALPPQRTAAPHARLPRVDWMPLCWGLTHPLSELLPLRRRAAAAGSVERKTP